MLPGMAMLISRPPHQGPMRVRSNRPNTIDPGMKLGPWGPGDERDVDDKIGQLLVSTAGFVEVRPIESEPDEEPVPEFKLTTKAKSKRGRKKKDKS